MAPLRIPGPVVYELRQRGHDVAAIAQETRGLPHAEVLAKAQREHRTVVTFDQDFGQLAFAARLPASCGARLLGSSPEIDNRRVVAALESRTDWSGIFAIVENDRIRLRGVPETPTS